ncbi:MAG: hypothetical protein ABEI27_06485 [Halobellus sp.]
MLDDVATQHRANDQRTLDEAEPIEVEAGMPTPTGVEVNLTRK